MSSPAWFEVKSSRRILPSAKTKVGHTEGQKEHLRVDPQIERSASSNSMRAVEPRHGGGGVGEADDEWRDWTQREQEKG